MKGESNPSPDLETGESFCGTWRGCLRSHKWEEGFCFLSFIALRR